MGCGASKTSNSVVELVPSQPKGTNSLASQTKTTAASQKSSQNKDIKSSGIATSVPQKQNIDPPASSVTEFKEEGNDEPIKQKHEEKIAEPKINSSNSNIPSKVPQVLFPITKPQLTDMNGEPLNGRKLPKLNAIEPSSKKLPPLTDK